MNKLFKSIGLVWLCLAPWVSAAELAKKPNFLFILVDDLGRQDLGCYGSTFHETPHVDALAKQGMKFSNAYSASPVCSPTRASIITGKYPARVNYTRATPTENLSLDEVTIAEALKEAGYQTAHMGKWHLQLKNAKGEKSTPLQHGFELNVAGHGAGQPASFFYPYMAKAPKYKANNVPDMADGQDGDYLTDALTTKAIDFMKASGEKPFFLNLWYYTVHTPVTGKKEKIKKYTDKLSAMGVKKPGGSDAEYQSHTRNAQDNPIYAAMVESMDENLGRLMDFLKESGLDENTVVIFTSDNGGLSTHKSDRGGPTCNYPLRAGKAWVYEGGVRAPLIVRWPGVTQRAAHSDAQVISTDFYPTMLEMAGLPLMPDQHLDGLSLAPLLRGEKSELDRQALYFHFPHDHSVNSMGASSAVRMGDYKLVQRFADNSFELFDLANDLGEKNDLSRQMPELTQKLRKQLENWYKETGAMMPKPKKPAKQVKKSS